MSQVVETQAPEDADLVEIDENATLNHKTDIINKLGTEIIMPGQVYDQKQKLDYGGMLMSGNQGAFSLSGSRTTVKGAPGVVISKQITVPGTAILSGASLICEGNTPAILVKATGRLVLNDCHIVKGDNLQSAVTDAYIVVEDGGYLVVQSSIFYGSQSNTGHLVYNYGNTLNAAVIGCIDLSDIVSPFHHVHHLYVVP